MTSLVWTGLEYFIIALPLDVARYVHGPLPETLCSFHVMLKNIMNFQTTSFCDAVTTARFLFIFYLKNPSEFQDEFWHIFVNIWIVLFGTLLQFVYVYLPGMQPISYYICAGLDPRLVTEETSVKRNYIFNFLLLISLVLQGQILKTFFLQLTCPKITAKIWRRV